MSSFEQPAYQEHNRARLTHLASLGLPLQGPVLDVGAGPGDHTSFYLERGCSVVAVDAREACLRTLAARFPQVRTRRVDLNDRTALDGLGGYDVVHAYGILYHLHDPAAFLAAVADRARNLLVLETCVSYGGESAINLVPEADEETQAARGQGCRPTRRWVFEELQRHFPYVYQTRLQPDHFEFPIDWRVRTPHALARIVLVASRTPLDLPTLSPQLLEQQVRFRTGPKLDLPSVTLVCADGLNTERAIVSLERCKSLCDFGDVKLLTNLPTNYEHRVEIMPLPSLTAYSIFMLKRVHEYIDTPHMLVVQHDGWIINAGSWDPAWLARDYVAPLFIHKHVTNPLSVGSGGFSLRSKAFMAFVAAQLPTWDGTPADTDRVQAQLGVYEDGLISVAMRVPAMRAGFSYATPAEAGRFAQGGNRDPAYHTARPFGFHGLWPNINHNNDGFVDVTDWEHGQ